MVKTLRIQTLQSVIQGSNPILNVSHDSPGFLRKLFILPCEPRKSPCYSPLCWLFNRDPYVMVYKIIPKRNWEIPLHLPEKQPLNNRGFFRTLTPSFLDRLIYPTSTNYRTPGASTTIWVQYLVVQTILAPRSPGGDVLGCFFGGFFNHGHPPKQPTPFRGFFIVNNLVLRWPKPWFFMVFGGSHGRYFPDDSSSKALNLKRLNPYRESELVVFGNWYMI